MSFFAKIASHARNEMIGLLNPNRRHDDPEERKADEIRAAINAGHRFESFAEERADNFVKWHIDGYDYFWAVSEMIENAKECIFIMDWWLTPELFLRRPPALYPEYRIDRLLKRKAEQGVKIHVIVYKEVTQTMSMSSAHTKKTLDNLHPNICCLRHPDHIGAKDSIQFWSHHEKVVVVDNHFAAIGGLDLCFGRWDTQTHPLADVHPTNFDDTIFPGQDYNNARVMDFQKVWNYSSNQISILETPRMPWHDVHMTFVGPVVLDAVQHFVERWNEIKKRKYRDKEEIVWLALPHNVEAMPNEAVVRHPTRETWNEMGHRYKERIHRHWHGAEGGDDDDDPEEHRYNYKKQDPTKFSCRVQVCRSISDWSHGYLTEHSIQNAYIKLIDESEHFIYIENQFFITNTVPGESVTNQIGAALVRRVVRAAKEGAKFKVVVVIPEVPGFSGDIKNESAIQTIMAAQWRSINRGGDSIYEKIREEGHEPTDYIRFYHLRAYDRINNPSATLIAQMEQNSGVSFHEAQVALARQWIGDPAELNDNYQTEVTFKRPPPSGEDKAEGELVTVKIPETEGAAKEIVERFEHGSDAIRGDEDVSDTIAQHMLLDKTNLVDELWMGSEEEELNAYVSELLYIHSKLMIVDDRRVIMGSANINDRSQKGDGDSEIALVVDDTDEIDSTMNGEPYKVTRFAASLRRKLYREHLGLINPQLCTVDSRIDDFKQPAPIPNPNEFGSREDQMVADPIGEETWDLWTDTAKKNRRIFQDLFKPLPSDVVRKWSSYDDYKPNVKVGHVVPGFDVQRVKEELSQVRGSLVEAPLDFLIEETDLVTGAEWTALNPTLPIYI